jgi:hypothetical protein
MFPPFKLQISDDRASTYSISIIQITENPVRKTYSTVTVPILVLPLLVADMHAMSKKCSNY